MVDRVFSAFNEGSWERGQTGEMMNSTQPERGLRHSGFGIASFVMAIIQTVGAFVLLVVAGYLQSTTPGGMDEKSLEAVLVGLGFFALVFLFLVGLGLGIAGVIQRDHRRLFAILGLTINSAILIVLGVVFSVGLVMR